MDKLAAIRTFVGVVQHGTFSAAGRALGTPKTRVSQRIQDLEEELETRLLQRNTRNVTLTDDGRVYFEKCLQILDDIDAADRAMRRGGEEAEGRLYVTVMSSVAHAVIIPSLQNFLRSFPNISVKITVTDRLVNLVEDGVDCAIRGGSLDNSSLISRHVQDVPFKLFASPGYLDKCGPILSHKDLTRVDRLGLTNQRTGVAQSWSAPSATVAKEPGATLRVECDDDQALLAACAAGAGVAMLAQLSAVPLVRSGLLAPVLPEWVADVRPIYLVYPSRRYMAAKLRCFIDWAAHEIQAAS